MSYCLGKTIMIYYLGPFIVLAVVGTSGVTGILEINLASQAEEDNQGDCVQLITCTSGFISGELVWYAEFPNGSEIRFARNDGGNAETNPPYDNFGLEGITNVYTAVTRATNDDLINYNSTLAFDVMHLVEYNLTSMWCGSRDANSTRIVPRLPQLNNETNYNLLESTNLSNNALVCNGTNIPLKLVFGNCSLNITSSILQWIINGTVFVQYDYSMGLPREKNSENSSIYNVSITSFERDGDKLNIISHLQLPPDLPPGTSISCGSNFFQVSYTTEVPGNSSLIKCEAKLTPWNIVLISIGLILLAISTLLLTIVIAFIFKRINFVFLIVVTILGVITVIIDVVFWIITAAVVAPQEDTCDTSWQSGRNGLIMVSFIVAFIPVIMAAVILLAAKLYSKRIDTGNTSTSQKAAIIVQSGFDTKDVEFDERGRSNAERHLSNIHRGFGRHTQAVTLDYSEKLTTALKEERHYDTTNFTTTSATNPTPGVLMSSHLPEYSELSREGEAKKRKNDYQHLHLREFENQPRAPPIPVQNSDNGYDRLNQDTSVHGSGNNTTTRKKQPPKASQSPKGSQPPKAIQSPKDSQSTKTTDVVEDEKLSKTNPPAKI